jgi:pimeloyl-ACP methyl ester carboxylesterase
MALLGPDLDLVAYDRRGFGTTTYEPEQYDHVVDLVAVLDALDLPRVVLVGNSQGGQVALSATLAHPDRVAALVLVAPAVSGAPEVTESEIEPAEAAIWETLEAADAAGALEALNLGEIRLWVDGPNAPEGRVGGPRRDLALAMNRLDLRHFQERCAWLAEHIPDAELVVMPGAAHLPGLEQPEEFAALLREFLAAHPG